MRSEHLLLNNYNTDKINNHYLEIYDPIFEPLVQKDIKLLELGIFNGGSLLLWRDYFPNGTIIGIDINLPNSLEKEERIQLFKGSQTDTLFLSHVANRVAPDGFDIIIDDASHIGEYTKQSFWHLFNNHLKPGGLYVIEDWRTSYLLNMPDGKRFKYKEGFLSRLRSSLKPHLSLLNKFYFEDSSQNTNLVFLFNRLIRIISNKLFPTSLRTGLLPPFNLLLKVPFETYCYGMVGFVKQLIDEQGQIMRKSKFLKMIITKNIVFISKAVD